MENNAAGSTESDGPRRKRPRKSRGRGLRTKTGCLTCRQRHKKCDEKRPICGPCGISSRSCVFPHDVMAGQTPPSPSTAEPGRPLVNLGARSSTVSSSSGGGAIHRGGQHYGGGGGIGSGSISGGISGSGSGSGQEAPAPPPPLPPPPPPSSSSPSSNHVVVNSGTSRVLPGNLEDAGPGSHRPTTSSTTAGTTTTTAASAATSTATGSTNGSGGVPGLQQEPSPGNIDNVHVASLQLGFSPDTIPYERWPADFASTRWLDLLASDAAQADSSFSLAGGIGGGSAGGDGASPSLSVNERSLLRPPVPRFPASLLAAHSSPALLNGQAQLPEDADPETERKAWQSDREARLAGREAVLFRHFADVCALWLDVFDPQRLFSTYATRLALRNPGLMKAILALAAKHRERALGRGRGRNSSGSSSQKKEKSGYDHDGGSVGGRSSNEAGLPEQGTDGGGVAGGGLDRGEDMADKDDDEWIRYYYETLHYVREALVFPSYTHSEELLATAIVISAYEMLDESDGSGNWQRHLKGVFWIQRSQEVNGSCGGLRQAVWWAWLRQDIWAAFRERRPCFSFWRPVTDVAELDQHGLADRAIYLLSQAVNYSAEARRVEKTLASPADLAAAQDQLRKRREDLVHKMERWKSFLGNEYRPLPTTTATATGTAGGTGGRGGPGADVFTPLWIHPPEFGVAQQAYSFAQILVTLHSPSATGFGGFLRVQRDLAQATDTICGIAMELRDPGCRMMSAQCLYGAGLCVQEPARREAVLALMEDCEASICWPPIATWRQDLRREWEKVDAESRL